MSAFRSGEGAEHSYDPLDPLLKAAQDVKDVPLTSRTLIDRYCAGGVGIYAYVRTGVGDEFVAVIYWPVRTRPRDFGINAFGRRDVGRAEVRRGDGESSMLVDPVEVMKDPKPVVLEGVGCVGRVSSLVRLFTLDERSRRSRDTSQGSWVAPQKILEDGGPVRRLPLPILVSHDWEHQRFLDLIRQRSEVALGEVINRVIERGTEIVDSVSGQERKLGRRRTLDLRPSNCVARLGIYLTTNGVGIRPEPAIDRVLKSFYVFAGPFELQVLAEHGPPNRSTR